MAEPGMQRSIGLAGATFTLIGYVIGASVFILPGQLAARTGPGFFVAYLLAAIPALLSCLVAAQVGSTLHVSGALYVAISRAVSPFWGFMALWAVQLAEVIGTALVAYGFADYLAYFVPGLPRVGVALTVALLFGLVNLANVRFTVLVQSLMTIAFLGSLALFGIGGVLHVHPGLMTPLFPLGIGVVAMAAIPAYFSFTGFLVLAELGGEIRNPGRTIPLALALSFGVVLVSYILVAVAVPGLLPWQSLSSMPAPVASAAEVFLPKWLAGFVSLGALFAATTSINGILLVQSRELYAVAKDRIFPERLAHLSPGSSAPRAAVVLASVLAAIGVLLGATIVEYAIMGVFGAMIVQGFAGLAVLRMPAAMPERFAASPFRLGRWARLLFGGGLMLSSAIFILIGVTQSVRSALTFGAFLAAGVGYYYWRRGRLRAEGFDLEEALRGRW
jgi:APA family basic amino acid/polyamine antiporter